MFANFFNNLNWDATSFANSNNPLYKSIIKDFFKPDKISTTKFGNNLEIAQATWEKMIFNKNELDKIQITPTMHFYKDVMDRPLGYPDWFLAGYPDVAYWLSQNIEQLQYQRPFNAFSEKKEYFIENGFVKPNVLRIAINYYKQNINDKLECSV